MGAVMIRCPETGRSIPTGYHSDPGRFRRTPVFFACSFCPICRTEHEWFAADAWVRGENKYLRPKSTPLGCDKLSPSPALWLRSGAQHDGRGFHAERVFIHLSIEVV